MCVCVCVVNERGRVSWSIYHTSLGDSYAVRQRQADGIPRYDISFYTLLLPATSYYLELFMSVFYIYIYYVFCGTHIYTKNLIISLAFWVVYLYISCRNVSSEGYVILVILNGFFTIQKAWWLHRVFCVCVLNMRQREAADWYHWYMDRTTRLPGPLIH